MKCLLLLSIFGCYNLALASRMNISKMWSCLWTNHQNHVSQDDGMNFNNDALQALVAKSWEYFVNDTMWKYHSTSSTVGTGRATVWTYQLPPDVYGSENLVLKTKGIVHGSANDIFELFFNSSRAREYNKYGIGRVDIEDNVFGQRLTKIVWNRTKPPGTTKPHDFCTLMHARKFSNGTIAMFSTAVEHTRAARSSLYFRSEILLGSTLIVPLQNGMTEVTTINHVKSCGLPSYLCNKLSPMASLSFIRDLDALFTEMASTQ
jgi:hypothetical protein